MAKIDFYVNYAGFFLNKLFSTDGQIGVLVVEYCKQI